MGATYVQWKRFNYEFRILTLTTSAFRSEMKKRINIGGKLAKELLPLLINQIAQANEYLKLDAQNKQYAGARMPHTLSKNIYQQIHLELGNIYFRHANSVEILR